MTLRLAPSLIPFNSNRTVRSDKMEHLNDILRPHVRASKVRLSYVDELFPDLKDNPYIILHKNVSDQMKHRFSLTLLSNDNVLSQVPGMRHFLDHEKNESSLDEYSTSNKMRVF